MFTKKTVKMFFLGHRDFLSDPNYVMSMTG